MSDFGVKGYNPKRLIISDDGKTYEKAKTGKVIAGSIAGGVTSAVAQVAFSLPALPAMSKMGNIAKSCDSGVIKKALDKALAISGMKDAGVKIVDYAGSVIEESKNKGFWSKIKEFIEEQTKVSRSVKKGTNACFSTDTNSIYINTEKLGTAGFHEIGHSINYNKSKALKFIQKARMPLMVLPVFFTAIALGKRKKVDGEKPKGFFDKTTTFIKEHVGLLSSVAMLPILGEELIATAKGNKLAKHLLSPENYKKVVKTNRYGALTYTMAVVGSGLAAYFANKIKDNIAGPKEIKQ